MIFLDNNDLAIQLIINKIYTEAGIYYFEDEWISILEETIKDIYFLDKKLATRLRINHIDRAIYKLRQAREKTCIHNIKQYFKACMVSAIKETVLENLEPIE